MRTATTLLCLAFASLPIAQSTPGADVKQMRDRGMRELGAYSMLAELTGKIGARLSGSPEAARAVEWGQSTMHRLGFQNVRLIPCMVPHWVRGAKEEVSTEITPGLREMLACCALGMSVATPPSGITAEVVEVKSLGEAAALGDRARGKIVFFNGPMDPTLLNTFAAYGGASGQRFAGAVAAAKVGAVAVLTRSLTLDPDNVPHTGTLEYTAGVPKIPAVALSIVAADELDRRLRRIEHQRVRLITNCETLPDVPSANVVGELVGTELPKEVITVGGHLDSWDLGKGAHDDGAGVVHSLEALRLLREMGWKPKRTIRVVLFMNEENGSRGARAYFDYARNSGEKEIAAIESDSGGFAPRFFSSSLKKDELPRFESWRPDLALSEIERIEGGGGGGADVGDLAPLGAVLFGLEPESQRYFDYHHSVKDTLDKVNPRELELGAVALATLAWRLSEEGTGR